MTGRGARARRALALVSLALVCLLAPALAAADDGRATVRLDGHALLRVGPAGGEDARARATAIERRLASLVAHRGEAPRVEIVRAGPYERALVAFGTTIARVTAADAADNLASVDAVAARWAAAIDAGLARARDERRSDVASFGANVKAAIRGALSGVLESAVRIVPRALAAVLVLAVFWLAATLARGALAAVARAAGADPTIRNLVRQVSYYAVWTLGAIVAVDALGVDRGDLVTGLGLTSLALGFALKDLLSNLVSGVLLLAMRPFRIRDQIVVGDTEGTVERVELRATMIRTYDGRRVLVPNGEIFTSRVTNNTASPVRRASVDVHLGYEVDLRRVREVVAAAVAGATGVLAEPAPSVVVAELGADDVTVEARFWADSRRSDFVQTRAQVREAIHAALAAAGIALPDPAIRRVVPAS